MDLTLKEFMAEVESGKSTNEVVKCFKDQRQLALDSMSKLEATEQERDSLKARVRDLEGLLQAAQKQAVRMGEKVKELEFILSRAGAKLLTYSETGDQAWLREVELLLQPVGQIREAEVNKIRDGGP